MNKQAINPVFIEAAKKFDKNFNHHWKQVSQSITTKAMKNKYQMFLYKFLASGISFEQ